MYQVLLLLLWKNFNVFCLSYYSYQNINSLTSDSLLLYITCLVFQSRLPVLQCIHDVAAKLSKNVAMKQITAIFSIFDGILKNKSRLNLKYKFMMID